MTDSPNKKSYLVLALTQNGVTRYYTNWNGGWNDGGSNTATVVPSLTARMATRDGGVTDKEFELDFNLGEDSTGWLDSLVSGEAHAAVRMVAQLGLVPFGPGQTETETLVSLGTYFLTRAVRNKDRQLNRCMLSFLDHRGRLHIPLGIACTPACAWTLGDKTCGVDVASAEETGTVAAVEGKTLTLTTGTDSSVVTSKPTTTYWQRGFVTFESLSIGIRVWASTQVDPYSFALVHDIPSSWLGEVVTLTPGCDKTPGTCNTLWSNLDRFGGLGIAIPRYHPVVENPS